MRDRRGFSLVELIVVVALIGAAVGLLSLSISSIFTSDVRKCANELDAVLSKCRVCAMSRVGPVYLKLTREDDGIHAVYHDGADETDDLIGGRRVTLTFQLSGSAAVYEVTEDAPLYLAYDRKTGTLMGMAAAYEHATGTPPSALPQSSGDPCVSVTATSGGSARTVVLVPSTGSHYVQG